MPSTRALATGGVPLLLGAAAVWASLQLDLGTMTKPGPGLWPLVVSVLLAVSSLAVLLTREQDGEPFTRASLTIAAALAGLVVFVVLFAQFGFVLAAALLLAGWLRFISKESWLMTIVVTVAAVAILYVLFAIALGVPFPFDLVTGR